MLQYFHLRGTDPMSNPWVGGMDLPLIPLTGFFNMLRISGGALVIWVFYYSPIYENFGQGNFFSISKMWVIRGPFLTNFGFWPLTTKYGMILNLLSFPQENFKCEVCICLLSRGEAPREETGSLQVANTMRLVLLNVSLHVLVIQVSTRDSITGPWRLEVSHL